MSVISRTRFPKFVVRGRTRANELRKAKGTSKPMILVPLLDLTFLIGSAADGSGTSNRRSSAPIPKFASFRGGLFCELRNQRSTSKILILVRFGI